MTSRTKPNRSATKRTDSAHARKTDSSLARGAWGLLLALSILGLINHVLGITTFAQTGDEQMMFALFAGVDLYALVVLLTAYRRGEQWAWALTWVHTVAYALAFAFIGSGIGTTYLIIAGVSALAQLAALPSLRRNAFGGEPRETAA